jgi:hypothetical protein
MGIFPACINHINNNFVWFGFQRVIIICSFQARRFRFGCLLDCSALAFVDVVAI